MKLGWASLRLGVMAASLAAGTSFASASVLYDNGAINGGINAWNISNGYAVENSFTLSSASTVTGVLFGLWSNPGDVISTVDLGISTTQGSFADNGTVPVTQGAFLAWTALDTAMISILTASPLGRIPWQQERIT